MMINLAYGKTGYIFKLNDHYHTDIIEPLWVEGLKDPGHAIRDSLGNPYNSKPLKDIAGKGGKVAIVFSDITRATPYNIILPALLNELQHIPDRNITFFCANGTHRLATDQELISILGENIFKNYEIIQNDANNPVLFEGIGTTSSGNEVLINKRILEYDLKIITGFIEPHFFAGFSGGGKALIPGLAYVKTIQFNHSIAHLSHEKVNWGITYGNPLWEEIMEAAELVPGIFLLNITLNKNKEITNVFSGELRSAHMAGCNYVKKSAMVPVDTLYDIVITSNSGFPLDLNIYQTVKGMSAAAQIVKKGGSIVMAAECWDGIPSGSDYEKILSSVKNSNELMEFIRMRESTLKDTWQIYFQAFVQQRAKVYFFSDKVDNEIIKRTLFTPVDSISLLIDELVKKNGPRAKICILPEEPQTIPYLS